MSVSKQDVRDTKTKILDAAEQLFAEHGITSTSLRGITNAANVNLAAVNYHFGSKDQLVLETFRRRIGPLNQARIAALDQLVADGEPTLEQVLETFLGPPLRMFSPTDRQPFMKLLGRLFSEPDDRLQEAFVAEMSEVASRYKSVLGEMLPHLPPTELFWRLHFMIGSMAHTLGCGRFVASVSNGICDPSDVEGTLERLIEFAAAGLRAPTNPRQDQTSNPPHPSMRNA